MKLDDLAFSCGDCCSIHSTTTVLRDDGVHVGIMQGDGDYTLSYYNERGLIDREIGATQERLDEVLERCTPIPVESA